MSDQEREFEAISAELREANQHYLAEVRRILGKLSYGTRQKVAQFIVSNPDEVMREAVGFTQAACALDD